MHTNPLHLKKEVILGVYYTTHKNVSLFLPPHMPAGPDPQHQMVKKNPPWGAILGKKTEGEVGGQEQGSEER